VVTRSTPGNPTGRRAAAAGAALVAVYLLLAAFSGGLTPLARRPLLDGLGPLQAYRWVAPPPDLAATNVEPSPLTFTLALTPDGVQGGGPPSKDGQITVIVPTGAVGPHGADTSVRFDVTPVDPAGLKPLGHDLAAFGNAYRIEATYLPSGTAVDGLESTLDVVLVYPVTVTLHTSQHEMTSSPDGRRWTVREGNDFVGSQQVEAVVPELGYVVVAGVPGLAPVIPSPLPSGGGSSKALALGLIVAAGCALLVGLGLVLRNRRA
jgi:hypothetical protein